MVEDVATFRNVAAITPSADSMKALFEWHGKDLVEHESYKDGRAIPPEYWEFRNNKGKNKDNFMQIVNDDEYVFKNPW